MLDFNELEKNLEAEFEEEVDEVETDDTTEEVETVEVVDEEVEVEVEVDEEDEIVPDESPVPTKTNKPTPEEKASFAFEKLRKENAETKKANAKLAEERRELEQIAKAYGYASHDEMLTALKEEALKKEAAKNNMDPAIYRRVQESEERVKRLEEERNAERRIAKLNTFVTSFDKFLSSNGLNETDKEDILGIMESDGYTLEDLMEHKKPEVLIRAYAVDKLKEKAVRDALAQKTARAKLKETKLADTGRVSELDDLDKQLADYFKKNANNKNY